MTVLNQADTAAQPTEDDWRAKVTTLPCGHEVLEADQVHYCSYIGLPLIEKLGRAHPETARARSVLHPDEYQFLHAHQVVETIFDQILHDLPRAREAVETDRFEDARRSLERMTTWMNLVVPVMSTFSTMRPEDFFRFRDALLPASGAESLNTRRIEIMVGVNVDGPYAVDRGRSYTYRGFLDRGPGPGKQDPKTRWWTDELSKLASQPTLKTAFYAAMSRCGETLESLHQSGREQEPLRLIADGLHSFDRAYSNSRSRHVGIAAQQIGKEPGTGHTSGVPFLKSTVDTRLLVELWELKHKRALAHHGEDGWKND